MPQQTFAEVTFEQYRKPTPREQFLDKVNRVVPWTKLVTTIEPVYPKGEGPGRPLMGIEGMLWLYCLHQWFNLSDPDVEGAQYDSHAIRQFVGIDRGPEPVPDETTTCKFRHEGPCGCGEPDEADSCRSSTGCQCACQPGVAQAAVWARDPGVG